MEIRKHARLLVVLFILAMMAVAGYASQKEFIFPEAGALALGTWVMEKSPWEGGNVNIWLSPTLAAFTGIIIIRFLAASCYLMIAGAFVLVALQLSLMRSSVMPSFSAAILPIFLNCNSWYYPLGVCTLTGIVAAGGYSIRFVGGLKNGENSGKANAGKKSLASPFTLGIPALRSRNTALELMHWAKIFAILLLVGAVALRLHYMFIMAPPLIVVLVELSKKSSMRKEWVKIFLLLALAAFSGVIWIYFVHGVMHWPIWPAAGLSILTLFLFFHLLKLYFPPAAAIAVLPVLLPAKSLWAYPWQVLSGSAVFLLIGILWFSKADERRGRVLTGRRHHAPNDSPGSPGTTIS
jgi:hypothetical protein